MSSKRVRMMTPPRLMLRIFSFLHVLFYRLSAGRIGARINGLPVLLLTTVGRKTGRPRTKPVAYMQVGVDHVIAPGVVENPAWYLNLKSNPEASIQTGATIKYVLTREAGPDEHSRLWAQAPAYWNEYQASASNMLPLVILRNLTAQSQGD